MEAYVDRLLALPAKGFRKFTSQNESSRISLSDRKPTQLKLSTHQTSTSSTSSNNEPESNASSASSYEGSLPRNSEQLGYAHWNVDPTGERFVC
jgi:hypothetical protein